MSLVSIVLNVLRAFVMSKTDVAAFRYLYCFLGEDLECGGLCHRLESQIPMRKLVSAPRSSRRSKLLPMKAQASLSTPSRVV
jgi:hypothetical protein